MRLGRIARTVEVITSLAASALDTLDVESDDEGGAVQQQQHAPEKTDDSTRIVSLSSVGIAGRCRIEVGDTLVSVNGRPVVQHAQCTELLLRASGEVVLVLRSSRLGEREVRLHKAAPQTRLGLTLSDSAEWLSDSADGGVHITTMREDGVAYLSQLHVGDELISVNGQAVLNHKHGTRLLLAACGQVSPHCLKDTLSTTSNCLTMRRSSSRSRRLTQHDPCGAHMGHTHAFTLIR